MKATATSPGDLTIREAPAQTIPDLPADDLAGRQDSVVADDSPAASEVVEEYIEK